MLKQQLRSHQTQDLSVSLPQCCKIKKAENCHRKKVGKGVGELLFADEPQNDGYVDQVDVVSQLGHRFESLPAEKLIHPAWRKLDDSVIQDCKLLLKTASPRH